MTLSSQLLLASLCFLHCLLPGELAFFPSYPACCLLCLLRVLVLISLVWNLRRSHLRSLPPHPPLPLSLHPRPPLRTNSAVRWVSSPLPRCLRPQFSTTPSLSSPLVQGSRSSRVSVKNFGRRRSPGRSRWRGYMLWLVTLCRLGWALLRYEYSFPPSPSPTCLYPYMLFRGN